MNKMKKKSHLLERTQHSRWKNLHKKKYLLMLIGALSGIAGCYTVLLAEKYLPSQVVQLLLLCIIALIVGMSVALRRQELRKKQEPL